MKNGIELDQFQLDAIKKMKNGCILCGGVGSGKSRTSLAYFYFLYGGKLGTDEYTRMVNPPDLYIITTAKKRDSKDWDKEMEPFHLSSDPLSNLYFNKVTVDSWNNLYKYIKVENSFFIFDEQRVTGNGVWVKSFLKVTAKNKWILLTATPGDTWSDYVPVFIANGFFKNRTQFEREHAVFNRYVAYKDITGYVHEDKLYRYRNYILIPLKQKKKTTRHIETIWVNYDQKLYKQVMKTRWDPFTNEPIPNASSLCNVLRRVVNSDDSRKIALMDITDSHNKAVIFYNFNFELDILKTLYQGTEFAVAEWNGHRHEPIPTTEKWVYLVHYMAGAEGWNCTETDTMIFFSQSYSYKMMEQASGRIDRRNTSFVDLYYYSLKTRSGIDLAISRALQRKEDFNARKFVTSGS